MAPPNLRNSSPSLPWALFGFRGRITRRTFWLAQLALMSVNSVFVAQVVGGPEARFHNEAVQVFPIVGALTLLSSIAVTVKRLHDFGMTGLFALGVLLPFVNVGVTLWAGIVPSEPGRNSYGSEPDRPD